MHFCYLYAIFIFATLLHAFDQSRRKASSLQFEIRNFHFTIRLQPLSVARPQALARCVSFIRNNECKNYVHGRTNKTNAHTKKYRCIQAAKGNTEKQAFATMRLLSQQFVELKQLKKQVDRISFFYRFRHVQANVSVDTNRSRFFRVQSERQRVKNSFQWNVLPAHSVIAETVSVFWECWTHCSTKKKWNVTSEIGHKYSTCWLNCIFMKTKEN